MLTWLKKKSIAKSKENIDTILRNLVPLCAELESQIVATGDMVTSGQAYQLMMGQREELRTQLAGLMEPHEVMEYVQSFLNQDGVPNGVRLAVEATIVQYADESGRDLGNWARKKVASAPLADGLLPDVKGMEPATGSQLADIAAAFGGIMENDCPLPGEFRPVD